MEIESKFLVNDEQTFQGLEALPELAGYSLSEGKVEKIEDTFLDTKDREVMASGYYLRLRREVGKEGAWLTMKSLGGFKGGRHRREEYVSPLPPGLSVLECPDFRLRNKVLELTAGLELLSLLELKQERVFRQLTLGMRHVAELSLDKVYLKNKSHEMSYNELEIELKEGGTLEDLDKITVYLLKAFNLQANPLAKFERALTFLEELPESAFLTHTERAICTQLKEDRDIYGIRAKLLLGLDAGKSPEELSILFGVPEPQIEALYSDFKKQGLSIFPFSTENGTDTQFHFQPGKGSFSETRKNVGFESWIPEALLEYYGADKTRAGKVESIARTLFERLSPYHGLPAEACKVLELAALLESIGNQVSPEDCAFAGKEVLLTHSLKNQNLHTLRLLALIIWLQNPEISPAVLDNSLKEAGIKLSPGLQNRALMLASLLRIAVSLAAQPAHVQLGNVLELDEALKIELKGPGSKKAAKLGDAGCELWNYLFGIKLSFKPLEKHIKKSIENELPYIESECSEKEKRIKKVSKKLIPDPEDSMAEFARKIFSSQFRQMLAHEKGTKLGKDIEELHDMRVAARKMQAAGSIFWGFLDPLQMKPYMKELHRTLEVLGAVRDLDVFRENAKAYLKRLPPGNEHALDPLFPILEKERKKAEKALYKYLDSEDYASFKKDFGKFLEVPGAGVLPASTKKLDALPHRIKDVLPSLVYARLAEINAYDEWVRGPYLPIERLHRLRIAAKGFRYTFEFFEAVLGRDAKGLIADFKVLQDHLGKLHDAAVAVERLRNYSWVLSPGHNGPAAKPEPKYALEADMNGIEDYLAFRAQELDTLLNTFPEAWAKVQSREFRQRVALALENLYSPQ